MGDKLFEAIVRANQEAIAGNAAACLHRTPFQESLPIAALTCIDPRLNRLFPGVLGLNEEDFIWLRNAGNIIFDPLSSMTRSIALACAIKGAREIAVIGHTDCRVGKMGIGDLVDRFARLGIPRAQLPDNLTEYFGVFASERQNVLKGAEYLRRSPLIARAIPVHGLMVDTASGRLEWVVNGYETFSESGAGAAKPVVAEPGEFEQSWKSIPVSDFVFPATPIGQVTVPEVTPSGAGSGAGIGAAPERIHLQPDTIKGQTSASVKKVQSAGPAKPSLPPVIPLAPPLRPKHHRDLKRR